MPVHPPVHGPGIFDASLAQVQTEQTLGLREVMRLVLIEPEKMGGGPFLGGAIG